MSWFQGWPDWFGEAFAGVITGGAVYMYRSWREAGKQTQSLRAGIISQLETLERLLEASHLLYKIQR